MTSQPKLVVIDGANQPDEPDELDRLLAEQPPRRRRTTQEIRDAAAKELAAALESGDEFEIRMARLGARMARTISVRRQLAIDYGAKQVPGVAAVES